MTTPDYAARRQQEIRERAEGPIARRRHMRYCRHDRKMVHAIGPSSAWRWAAPALCVLGFLAVIGMIFVDPIGIPTMIAALLLIAAVGPAIALSRRVPRCPDCGREVPYHSAAEAEQAQGAVARA